MTAPVRPNRKPERTIRRPGLKSAGWLFLVLTTGGFAVEDTSFVTRMLAYRDLIRVTEQKIDMLESVSALCADPSSMSGPHLKPGIHIYANELAVKKAREGQARFPIGALIVKEKFAQKKDATPDIITVMEKFADTGKIANWHFAMIRLSDHAIVQVEPARSCTRCHSRYDRSDFVSETTDQLLRSFADKKHESPNSPAPMADNQPTRILDSQWRMAASDVSVEKTDFAVPENESTVSEALANRFFNQPEEERYNGITSHDWEMKWELFSRGLVGNAKAQGLDSHSLETCLLALNRGRNRQTMLWPLENHPLWTDKTPKSEIEAWEKAAAKKDQQALTERNNHPEKWYDDSLAIVPVAAYLARHAKGKCWIVVCKWEMITKERALPLTHTKVWALDTKSASVVGFATCD